jgi:hypothetical protein
MVTINILDHLKSASTYEDGGKIYQLLKEKIAAGETVSLSFKDISSVPSAFLNAAVIQLLEDFSFVVIKKQLRFINTTKHINQLIKSRFEFANK